MKEGRKDWKDGRIAWTRAESWKEGEWEGLKDEWIERKEERLKDLQNDVKNEDIDRLNINIEMLADTFANINWKKNGLLYFQ